MIPDNERNLAQIVGVMRKRRGPFEKFPHYYSLEETIELYTEVWAQDNEDV